jgi:UDP-N-acetylglucosamine 3-dehydrogenase
MTTTDYRELLASDVEAVLVCVPTHLHSRMAVDALEAGKHVFCQKPLARTLDQASAIQTALSRSGKQLQVGFVRRFDAQWLAFRDAIQAEKIGRPAVWHDASAHAGPSAPWYFADDQGGGPFLDGCIHNLDFALYTFGPAAWAFGHLRTFREGITALDTGTATIHFASGDELLLVWSWGLPPRTGGARVFEFLGPRGTITWPSKPADSSGEEEFVINRGESQEHVTYPAGALNTAFENEMDEFIQVARGECSPRAGIQEGVEALRLGLAILESGRSSQVVPL